MAGAKICGLSTPETVQAALDGMAEFIGFMFFDRSPRAVDPETAARLSAPARGKTRIVAVTVDYLSGQIEAGAEAVQLFDSWAGSLSPAQFERWVIAPNAAIAAEIHRRHPGVPVIGFPKGAGEKLAAYARETGVDAVRVDETIDPLWAAQALPAGLPLQGNLDPLLLLAGSEELERQALRVLEAFAGRPHVFNLGHGIGQFTPIAHVERLLKVLRQWGR